MAHDLFFLRGVPVIAAEQGPHVVHPCLEPISGHNVPVAHLSDKQRIGLLLQAAGLLSLLDRAGWSVPDWTAVRFTPEGFLSLPVPVPGRSEKPAQEILRDLLIRVFRLQGSLWLTGKGPARKVARRLLDCWYQSLAPVTPDEAVVQILDGAPFLWEPAFADSRAALAGEVRNGGLGWLWVAGPGPFRLRLLLRCRSLGELRRRLAGSEAATDWNGGEERGDPMALAAARRWRSAVAAWAQSPPQSEPQVIEMAASLAALGRTEAALAALEGLRQPSAECVRARCQLELGQIGAAQATLGRVRMPSLNPEQAATLAEVASRVLANAGKAGQAEPWVRLALEKAGTRGNPGNPAWLRAGIVAAAAAWDRGDLAEMERWLEATQEACDPRRPSQEDLAWRWHQVRALGSDRPDRLETAVEHAGRAIRLGRRRLMRHEAAGLWNELGVARARLGDLSGAERAFLHAVRLFEACDGPRKTTLALPNLAEIRLRRGRLAGVREILERTVTENRLAGNVRGLAEDTALRARFELLLGRPEAALALCREAVAVGWNVEVARLLAARALGWLGRPEEAAAELALLAPQALAGLEPEERPALRALAGDPEGALKEAEGTPFHSLWKAVLAGAPAPLSGLAALGALEPYRAARLVFDLDLVAPGCVPAPDLRPAAAVLRRTGALVPAGRLEARDRGPWQALVSYLEKPAGDPEAAATLLREAGVGGGSEDDVLGRAVRLLVARDSDPCPAIRTVPAAPATPAGDIAGESPALIAALERIARLAPGDLPILILGESGTGKELAARRIHRSSLRARSPFVPVNCAALSETLILSELFGHARGAFTGADRSRQGVFETAHGGTVFLDEIGDLPLSAQGLLLRVLQEGEVRPLGEPLPKKVSVRVIAATHRDLSAMVEERTFRQDLYFRLRVGSVTLPPLRERGEDVLLLAERFLFRLGADASRLSRAARSKLIGYSWPGNVRELQNVLSVAAALAGNGPIEARHVELAGSPDEDLNETSYHQQLDDLRRRLLVRALEHRGRNLSEVARYLGLSRQAVSYMMKRLKID
ncbi:MAG: sigma 54-interacting transcriptional regulator [Acidobacteriota bacterium]